MPKIHLTIEPPYREAVAAEVLRRAATAALQDEGISSAALSLLITDSETVRRLNARYRGIDAPTDVLSFEDDSTDPETGERYLGDIVIAYPQAAAQAERGGHPVAWELCLLTVHGVLHLLGHDHADPDEKARMWAAQGRILESLGFPLSPP
jgi:probable rRNA maturation factor